MGPHLLTQTLWFPPAEEADDDGVLAVGGDLQPERLLLAYRLGIFPWYEGDVPVWWHPDPRFVLFPPHIYISKSMQQVLRRNIFQFTTNTAFEQVISNCSTTPRNGQDGTWINAAVQQAYTHLHHLGYAHSFEAWQNNQLVGGLYGIKLGNIFFGESMFSHATNASKAAFIWAVQHLKQLGVVLVDCQVYTPHLESLGAVFITRNNFLDILKAQI